MAPGGSPDRSEMLLEAGLALASELSLPALLERIVELAVKVTNATYGALGVLAADGRIEEFITVGMTREERERIGPPPVGRGLLGHLITLAEPIRVPDIGEHPRSVGFPPNHPPMRSFLGAPVKAGGRIFGNLYLTEKKDGPEFSEEDERDVVILASQAGVAIENARLYEEMRLRERRLEATREITEAILSGSEDSDMLELVALRARELIGADVGTVAVPSSESGMLVLAAADGKHAEELVGMRFPAEGSLSGRAMSEGRPVVVEDMSSDDRAHQPMARAGEIGPAMFVPLASGGRTVGTLAVANMLGGRAFGDQDVVVVQVFAGQASIGLEYARVRRELERLAVMEDRERIAKELHDGVIQSLFAVGMGLQATATMSRDAEIESRVESAVGEIDRVIRDLRNYIFGLRPGILADRQLDQALRLVVQEFEERTGTTAVAEIDAAVAAELASRASDILQLTREALSNVGRHANAMTCRVSLVRQGRMALLEIDDDGTGFDPAARSGAGQGLRNLEERAMGLGGGFELRSVPGDGTTVRVTIPL